MVEIEGKKYRELYCDHCKNFIMYEHIHAGRALYICPRCGRMNEYTFNFLNVPLNLKYIVEKYGLTKDHRWEGAPKVTVLSKGGESKHHGRHNEGRVRPVRR